MDRFYEEFGTRLREARRQARLSQEQLANRIGISRASVANIERGAQRVALHQVVEVAGILGIEPVQLIPKHQGDVAQLGNALREAGESSGIIAWGERAIGKSDISSTQSEESND